VRALVSFVGLAVTLFDAATDETNSRMSRWGVQNKDGNIGIIGFPGFSERRVLSTAHLLSGRSKSSRT
jgi:hypothetical protein